MREISTERATLSCLSFLRVKLLLASSGCLCLSTNRSWRETWTELVTETSRELWTEIRTETWTELVTETWREVCTEIRTETWRELWTEILTETWRETLKKSCSLCGRDA